MHITKHFKITSTLPDNDLLTEFDGDLYKNFCIKNLQLLILCGYDLINSIHLPNFVSFWGRTLPFVILFRICSFIHGFMCVCVYTSFERKFTASSFRY